MYFQTKRKKIKFYLDPGVYNWLKKPRANQEGFYNASGKQSLSSAKMITCKRPNGTYYQENADRGCINYAVQVK